MPGLACIKFIILRYFNYGTFKWSIKLKSRKLN
ncbi:TPA: porin, partial [Salmonella enterica subsp. houtenae serovar 44:z4,z23:-]|nr:porin [Salmonella enterica subsp. houtenae serovar 44:z4,z23:-]